MKNNIFIFLRTIGFILLIYASAISICSAQKTVSKNDSVPVAAGYVLVTKDTFYIPDNDTVFHIKKGIQYSIRKSPYFKSDKFYDSLKSKASRSKLTKSLYDLLIKSSSSNISDKKPIIDAEEAFRPFVGKRYGKIIIKRVPVLEGSVQDTSKQARSWYGKYMNKFHVSTKKQIIKENILFESGDKVDPFKLADNERILRQFRTIRDAKIYLSPSTEDPEVVDVIVVTQDVISIGAALSATTPDNFTIDLYDRNILGFARDLQLTYDFDEHENPQKKHGYGIRYRVPNFWGTFINGDFLYENYFYREQLGMFLSRDFFTPEIKYGGGVTLAKINSIYTPLLAPDVDIPYSNDLMEVWLGRSYQFKKRTNFLVQALWQRNNFTERPFISENVNRFFTNNNLYLLNFAILKRTYSKTRLIRGFGRTEDLTKGYLFSFTYGLDDNEFYKRDYTELEVSFANYFSNWGYFYLSNTLGIFRALENKSYEDGILKSQLKYFSPLMKYSKSFFRQFLELSYSKGIDLKTDTYLLVDNNFNNENIVRPVGNEKISLNTESVFFTPWYFYGCKFSLYNNNNFSWLGSQTNLLKKNNFFSSFSIGLRLLNESLVFPTIELKFTYYNSPIGYRDEYVVNLFNNYGNRFQDLSKGKPTIIKF